MRVAAELSYDECRTLLTRESVGRVALVTPTAPHIVPVSYVVVGDSVVFRTAPYSVVGTYGWNTALAFEVDRLDQAQAHGWSVVATGYGHLVESPGELDEIRRVGEPDPWVDGPRTLYVRLPWRALTGRRIGDSWPARIPGHEPRPA